MSGTTTLDETDDRFAQTGEALPFLIEETVPREFGFTFSDGETVLAEFVLGPGEYVIGSAASCEISVGLEGIAPEHARLRLATDATIEDLQSGAGTRLNGDPVSGAIELPLGQPVTFGAASAELRLRKSDPPAEELPRLVETAAPNPRKEASHRKKAARKEKKERALRKSPPRPPEPANRASPPNPPHDAAIAEVTPPAPAGEPPTSNGFTVALADFEIPAEASNGVGGSDRFVTQGLAPNALNEPDAPDPPRPFAPESQEGLASLRDQLEAEVFRLKVEVERLRTEQSDLGMELAQNEPPAVEKERAGLLAVANGVLFKKFTEASESAQRAALLSKQLKQREQALVEAWDRRQAAEERSIQLGRKLARYEQGLQPERHPSAPKLSALALSVGAALLAAVLVLVVAFRAAERRAQSAEAIVDLLRGTAPQLHAEAVAKLDAGELRSAAGKVSQALALEAEFATYHLTNGRIHELWQRIPEAVAAYERALALDPALPGVAQSLELCQRIGRSRQGMQALENQYALHRLAMEQRRFREALQIAQRIEEDRLLLQKTWAALLTANGVDGDLSLNEEGSFDLELRPGGNGDLGALRGLPLRSLKAARCDITDLSPLAGMPLKRLDLAGTRVRDLTPLQGMPLEALDLSNTFIVHLLPLTRMPLQQLRIDHTAISDVTEVRGMPLRELSLAGTRVWNLEPLATLPLKDLNVAQTPVKDIATLEHLPLERLNLEGTAVTELRPLRGARLTFLNLSQTPVVSLEPLRAAPLRHLTLAGCNHLQSLEPLTTCTELERLVLPRNGPTAAPLRKLPSLRFVSYDDERESSEGRTAQQFWNSEPR